MRTKWRRLYAQQEEGVMADAIVSRGKNAYITYSDGGQAYMHSLVIDLWLVVLRFDRVKPHKALPPAEGIGGDK